MAAAAPLPESVERRIELALLMIELGAWVFPLARDSKQPLVPKAKGGHGFLDASPDPEMTRRFLSNPGQVNYGVVFPEGSDVIVLDIDGGASDRPGWRDDWQRLYDRYGPPGLTLIVRTPSDGRHAYYRWRTDLHGPIPSGDEMLGWTVRKPWKGYLVGPGSVVGGREYEVTGLRDIRELAAPWCQAALAEKTPTGTVITIGGTQPATVQTGQRHAYLRDRARHLRGIGLTGEALFAAVVDLNRQMPQPKTDEEVRQAIGDVESKFDADPVTVDPDTGEVTTHRPWGDDPGDLLGDEARAAFPEPPDRAAFGGLAGELVASVLGGTDASEAGLLASLLTLAGVLAPSRCYVLNRDHVSALHTCLVGDSSIGRKTTAMDRMASMSRLVLGDAVVNRVVMTGTNSGESLVTSLERRQLDYKREPTTAVVYEEEYATLLSAVSREGSSLDARLRVAFDGTQAMANRKASGAQTVQPPYWLAALTGITPTELQEKAPTGVLRSGSANRWLWLPVVRRPDGGDSPPSPSLVLREALVTAHQRAWAGPVALEADQDVRRALSAYDDHLRRTTAGQAVDLSLRLPTIATRIAMVHATLDGSARLTVEHLRRGIALTEYAREGVPWTWGYAVGDPLATYVLRDLVEAGGLTKRQVTQRWSRDQIRVQKAIDELRRLRFVDVVKVTGTGGRPRSELRIRPDHARFERFDVVSSSQPRNRETPEETPTSPTTQLTHETHESPQNAPNAQNAQNAQKPQNDIARDTVDASTGEVESTTTGDWHRQCRDYTAHRNKHTKRDGKWICTACEEEAKE